MLTTIFSYKGADFKSSRMPDSFDSLCYAATKIKESIDKSGQDKSRNMQEEFKSSKSTPMLQFSYEVVGFMAEPSPIDNDSDLFKAIDYGFKALDRA